MRATWILSVLLLTVACDVEIFDPGRLAPPRHLTYFVEASGTPGAPSGVTLRWEDDGDPALQAWNVYARGQTSGGWTLVGTTTSPSFHDRGIPRLQYEVRALSVNGAESAPSNRVTVDERLALSRPASLISTSLNRAIALYWSDNAFTENPSAFAVYRVYGTSYDLDQNTCGTQWALEGTTVAPEFVVAALANGVSRCFAVSAISIEGFESLWSPLRFDTPRPDARNVVVWARQANAAAAGFRFWRDLNANGAAEAGELGLVGPGTAPDVDFTVERDPANVLFLTPVRNGTRVTVYGATPVADLTSIDVAPLGGYARTPIEALPGWGYVFEMNPGGGFLRFGAVRVSHVGRDFLMLDWAYQTDPGNPELSQHPSP